jgi:2-amino-4-hydroxy-6-hydroxymethyldihydropteridine diphosphokinase
MKDVVLGLGSNVDAKTNLRRAADMLRAHWPDIEFSSVYDTAPREVTDQANFLNAVAMIQTNETPWQVQVVLKKIEAMLKKAPPYKFGPRTIDLDILLYGNDSIARPDLVVPHPRMHERRFVLEPLLELEPTLRRHPVFQEPWENFLEKTADQATQKLAMRL